MNDFGSTGDVVSHTLDVIREDPSLACFLSEPTPEKFEQETFVADQVSKVKSALDMLTKDIYSLVTDNYDSLIDHSSKLEILHNSVIIIQQRITAILEALDRLKGKLSNPYTKISPRIVLLNRLKVTTDLLRKIIRLIQLVKRLNQLNPIDGSNISASGSREIAKCSQVVSEIEALISSDERLLRIKIIESDIAFAREMKEKLASFI